MRRLHGSCCWLAVEVVAVVAVVVMVQPVVYAMYPELSREELMAAEKRFMNVCGQDFYNLVIQQRTLSDRMDPRWELMCRALLRPLLGQQLTMDASPRTPFCIEHLRVEKEQDASLADFVDPILLFSNIRSICGRNTLAIVRHQDAALFPNLERLEIQSALSVEAVESLKNVLPQLPSLRSLDIISTGQVDRIYENMLCEAVAQHGTYLTNVYLRWESASYLLVDRCIHQLAATTSRIANFRLEWSSPEPPELWKSSWIPKLVERAERVHRVRGVKSLNLKPGKYSLEIWKHVGPIASLDVPGSHDAPPSLAPTYANTKHCLDRAGCGKRSVTLVMESPGSLRLVDTKVRKRVRGNGPGSSESLPRPMIPNIDAGSCSHWNENPAFSQSSLLEQIFQKHCNPLYEQVIVQRTMNIDRATSLCWTKSCEKWFQELEGKQSTISDQPFYIQTVVIQDLVPHPQFTWTYVTKIAGMRSLEFLQTWDVPLLHVSTWDLLQAGYLSVSDALNLGIALSRLPQLKTLTIRRHWKLGDVDDTSVEEVIRMNALQLEHLMVKVRNPSIARLFNAAAPLVQLPALKCIRFGFQLQPATIMTEEMALTTRDMMRHICGVSNVEWQATHPAIYSNAVGVGVIVISLAEKSSAVELCVPQVQPLMERSATANSLFAAASSGEVFGHIQERGIHQQAAEGRSTSALSQPFPETDFWDQYEDPFLP